MTFPKFVLENLGKLFSKIVEYVALGPCCQDLVPVKNFEKLSFCVIFIFGNVGSGSRQVNFPVSFICFLLTIVDVAIVLTEKRSKTANVSKYFLFALSLH